MTTQARQCVGSEWRSGDHELCDFKALRATRQAFHQIGTGKAHFHRIEQAITWKSVEYLWIVNRRLELRPNACDLRNLATHGASSYFSKHARPLWWGCYPLVVELFIFGKLAKHFPAPRQSNKKRHKTSDDLHLNMVEMNFSWSMCGIQSERVVFSHNPLRCVLLVLLVQT